MAYSRNAAYAGEDRRYAPGADALYYQRAGYRRRRKSRRVLRKGVRRLLFLIVLVLLFHTVLPAVIHLKQTINVGRMELLGCPESLISLYRRNEETEQFVLDYADYEENGADAAQIDVSKDMAAADIPLFLQWDERWGYEMYGSDFLAVTGCGPTCLAMVKCGLSGEGKWNPLRVAHMSEEKGYYVDGVGTAWDLMMGGAERLGLTAKSLGVDEEEILAELKKGHPIICSVRPGDFTTAGHFIVLAGLDDDGAVRVCDPNSRKNSQKSWDIDRLLPQIKSLWSYRA